MSSKPPLPLHETARKPLCLSSYGNETNANKNISPTSTLTKMGKHNVALSPSKLSNIKGAMNASGSTRELLKKIGIKNSHYSATAALKMAAAVQLKPLMSNKNRNIGNANTNSNSESPMSSICT
uniref:Ammonium transporter Rh type C-like 2 n=1 Tax=Lygus hesperus TaxID=30085 RepID=A0A0A9YPV6_LYGHE